MASQASAVAGASLKSRVLSSYMAVLRAQRNLFGDGSFASDFNHLFNPTCSGEMCLQSD
jgi:hypothetical protein